MSREAKLREVLNNSSLIEYWFDCPIFDKDKIKNSKHGSEIAKVYHDLGGILNNYPSNVGRKWDIRINGLILELDEEQHFNQYRLQTLNSTAYIDTPFLLEEYRRYCMEHEDRCIGRASHGNYWKNDSTERQFGLSAPARDLTGNGSSRWKQRAFYDYYKDIGCNICGIILIRIPIYIPEYINLEQENYNSRSVERLVKWILNQAEIRKYR